MTSSRTRARAVRAATVGAFALAAVAGATVALPATASATGTTQLPYMCFNTTNTFHQIFGPNSFFLNENQQGPTSFAESQPNAPPVAKLPLYAGTAAGHRVFYIITDASDQAVATSLGVNYTPKLANAAGTPAVQHSSSNNPQAINVPAGVDFSPAHVLTPGPDGFPPSAAQAGAVGNPGYSPLVQLPSGVVLNAEQIGDGTIAPSWNKAHWADKVETVDPYHHKVGYDITNGCYENQSVHYISTDSSNPTAAAIEDVTYAPPLEQRALPGVRHQRHQRHPTVHQPRLRARGPDRLHQRPDRPGQPAAPRRERGNRSTTSPRSTSLRTCPTAAASSTTARCGTSTSCSGTPPCRPPTGCGRPTSPPPSHS